MPLRNARPLVWHPRGVSDTADATNAFPGAMMRLRNLIPSTSTPQGMVPRPASIKMTDFAGFSNAQGGSSLFIVGSRVYGMIGTNSPGGKDRPFCYDVDAEAFVTISGVTAANLPNTQSIIGDWNPPSIDMTGGRIIFTHPGFTGVGGMMFGWLDISGFTSTGVTGDVTSGDQTIINLSGNPLILGWRPGMSFSAFGVLADTTIVSMTASTVTVSTVPFITGTRALTVAGGTLAAPMWSAGNTNINPLADVPRWAAQFNGRMWYAVNNTVVFSDALNPTNVTNANQALTIGDDQDVTVLVGLPLTNQFIGGIVQSLMAFKGDSAIYQITGDATTSDLKINEMNVATGTLAPRTICATPLGLAFISPSGLRIIGLDARVSEPIGTNGEGVAEPFLNAVWPTRMCAAFNQNVLRISVKNGATRNDSVQEWWFDFKLHAWTGPHDFPASMIVPYQGIENHGFVLFADNKKNALWRSAVIPTPDDVFVEDGDQMTFATETALLPDNGAMAMNAVVETTLACRLPANMDMAVSAHNEEDTLLDGQTLSGDTEQVGVWGAPPAFPGVWGAPAIWGTPPGIFKQRRVPWDQPLVFKQMTVRMTGDCVKGFLLENLYLKYQILGYQLQDAL